MFVVSDENILIAIDHSMNETEQDGDVLFSVTKRNSWKTEEYHEQPMIVFYLRHRWHAVILFFSVSRNGTKRREKKRETRLLPGRFLLFFFVRIKWYLSMTECLMTISSLSIRLSQSCRRIEREKKEEEKEIYISKISCHSHFQKLTNWIERNESSIWYSQISSGKKRFVMNRNSPSSCW